jgi:hypothetical protein
METAETIQRLVARELLGIVDTALAARLKRFLVGPYPVDRDWDYGSPGQTYRCWTVLEHPPSDSGIAFCSEGFGPSYPWGIVSLFPDVSIGMDSLWHLTLEAAMRASPAWEGGNPEDYEVP